MVHPSPGDEDDSVVHRLLPWLPVAAEDFRPGVVHRLDRDTTGLLILARTQEAKAKLSQMIHVRQVQRDRGAHSAVGHPVEGDPLYGPSSRQGTGQLLHAMGPGLSPSVFECAVVFLGISPSGLEPFVPS